MADDTMHITLFKAYPLFWWDIMHKIITSLVTVLFFNSSRHKKEIYYQNTLKFLK